MDTQQSDNGKKAKARQKLVEDLAALASGVPSIISGEENEMLSLIVDEASKNVDIETRYPDFYKKLLGNKALRQAFLDTLEAIELEQEGNLVPFPSSEKPNLAFLHKKINRSSFLDNVSEPWKITLQRTIQELKNVFSPPQLAYRADANLFEDNWFTVLRDEIELGESSYSILLECGLSKETEDALSTYLNIAMTLESMPDSNFPIRATLHWGKYTETLTIIDEGRIRFPDVPFSATFDLPTQAIASDLELVLEIEHS